MPSDLAVMEKRPPGRPRKVQNRKRLSLNVEVEILDEFTRKAQALGMSQADRVRMLIENDLRTQG